MMFMKYMVDDREYNLEIIRKSNKNTYIRVKDDLTIYVTTNYFTTNKQIIKLLDQNNNYLRKSIDRIMKRKCKLSKFFYLGDSYDIIYISNIEDIDIDIEQGIIYTKDEKMINKWLNNRILEVFKEHFETCFHNFKESDDIPILKIRKMKTRWGVYNRVKHSVTLNSHLIEYDLKCLDYVIYHELSHIIHFNHSKKFWDLVGKYCPDYKQIKKKLKE